MFLFIYYGHGNISINVHFESSLEEGRAILENHDFSWKLALVSYGMECLCHVAENVKLSDIVDGQQYTSEPRYIKLF